MDLSFTDAQQAIADLAASIFHGEVDVERIKAIEATDDTFDRRLWQTLASTGMLGVALPEESGGTGGGVIELCCLLEQQGRVLAPVPLAHALVAAGVIALHGTGEQQARWVGPTVDGSVLLTVAIDPAAGTSSIAASRRADGWRLDGSLPAVAFGIAADAVLVAARTGSGDERGLFLVDLAASGIEREPVRTTDQLMHAHLEFDAAPAEQVGDGQGALEWLAPRLQIALSAVALGVAEEALRRAAAYTSERHQFGKPLSSFQSTAHRAADAYIDVEAMRATLWQAAWTCDEGAGIGEIADVALVAAWWAADAGQRVVHAVQHLHGGMGADTDYPVHRYFLWGTQLEHDLGGASSRLEQLGEVIARRARDTQEAAR